MSEKLNNAPIGAPEATRLIEASDKLPEPSKLKEKLLATPQLREFLKTQPDIAKRLDVLDATFRNAVSNSRGSSIEEKMTVLYNSDYLVKIQADFSEIEDGLS
jgi:hypothetical protein